MRLIVSSTVVVVLHLLMIWAGISAQSQLHASAELSVRSLAIITALLGGLVLVNHIYAAIVARDDVIRALVELARALKARALLPPDFRKANHHLFQAKDIRLSIHRNGIWVPRILTWGGAIFVTLALIACIYGSLSSGATAVACIVAVLGQISAQSLTRTARTRKDLQELDDEFGKTHHEIKAAAVDADDPNLDGDLRRLWKVEESWNRLIAKEGAHRSWDDLVEQNDNNQRDDSNSYQDAAE